MRPTDPDEAPAPEPPPMLSRAMRRSERRAGARILAILSLAAAIAAVVLVVRTALEPDAPEPLGVATAPAWRAMSQLSDALRELRPGARRGRARALVKPAAEAVDAAEQRVEALDLETAETPARSRVLSTLRADAAWIEAVGATLANSRSRRRGMLARLAETAASRTAVVAETIEEAEGSVGGTGRLLAATRRA